MTGHQTLRNTLAFDEYTCLFPIGPAGADRSLSALWQLFHGVPRPASSAPYVPEVLFRNRE
jgi:hypothetical protein